MCGHVTCDVLQHSHPLLVCLAVQPRVVDIDTDVRHDGHDVPVDLSVVCHRAQALRTGGEYIPKWARRANRLAQQRIAAGTAAWPACARRAYSCQRHRDDGVQSQHKPCSSQVLAPLATNGATNGAANGSAPYPLFFGLWGTKYGCI